VLIVMRRMRIERDILMTRRMSRRKVGSGKIKNKTMITTKSDMILLDILVIGSPLSTVFLN